MSNIKSSVTRYLRILSAALLSLLPMAPLDNLFLGLNYTVRGERPLPKQVLVQSIDRKHFIESLHQITDRTQPLYCVVIQLDVPPNSYCKALDLNTFFSLNSIIDLKTQFAAWFDTNPDIDLSKYEPYYYTQNPIPAPLSPSQVQTLLNQEKISLLIIVPTDLLPPYKIETPIGMLSNYQIAINMMGNFINNDLLQNTNYKIQITLSIAMVALFALFILHFPAWLSGLVLTGFLLCYFVITLIFLDQFKWILPLAAPLLCLVLSYFLGIMEQLRRQDKDQWALKREAEFLRELDDLKNHFLSLVSHDLKTPIARIQTLLEQLALKSDEPLEADSQKNLIKKAMSANAQLQRSIGTLLLLNRVESRDFRIQKKPTDLKALIEISLKSLYEIADDKNITIKTDLEDLFLVELDASLIQEVIYNLVDNAIKYSPPNSQILIRCGENDVLSELTPPQAGVWFEVQDFGDGIDPADRHQVLKRFYSTDSKKIPSSQPIKGTGLGLYLSAFFITKHEGEISILSRCPEENLNPEDRALEYFPEKLHGTVLRVALPIESLYDEDAP